MALGSLGKLFVEVGADTTELERGLDGAEKQVDKFGKNVAKTGKATGAGMYKAGKGLTAGITLPLAAAGVGFMTLSGKASGFENQMNRAFTLLPGISEKAMGEMEADVLSFSREMGILPEEAVPALYQALSAGVPQDNVFEFMRTAAEASIGGAADLETTVDGLTSVVNAYGKGVLSAAEASDKMALAATLGKTDIKPMSEALYNVIPTASALGVKFGTVAAALATMTAAGTPTAVATTQLRQMMVELSKEGTKTSDAFKEVAGVGFQEFIAQGGTVQGALSMIGKAADEDGVALQDMFSSVEGGNAALLLAGSGAESFADNTAAMGDSLGAANDKFETMNEGASRSMDMLKAEFGATMIEIGNEFIPILKDDLLPIFRDDLAPLLKDVVVPAIKGIAGAFSALSPGMKKVTLVVVALAAALGPVLMVLGPIISGATALAPVIASLGAVIGGVALGPLVAIVVAILAVIYAFKHWDEIASIIGGVFGKVFDYLYNLDKEFKKAGWNLMVAFANGIIKGITKAVDAVKGAVGKVRAYLPGSDAEVGPLSDLTASGAALMSTFEKGIASSSADPGAAFASRAPQVQGVGNTTNYYSSNTSTGDVNLSRDYSFEMLMRDMAQYHATQRTQKGVR